MDLNKLKPMPGVVASVAHFITDHEQTQFNRVCYFDFFGVFFASEVSNLLRTYISLLVLVLCRMAAVKGSP